MVEIILIALAPFYTCAVIGSIAVTMIGIKAGVALFGNAQELQDKKSE